MITRDDTGPVLDLPARPVLAPQPDEALEQLAAVQAAVGDAATGRYDVPGLLGSADPIERARLEAAWLRLQQMMNELRGRQAVDAGDQLALKTQLGLTEMAPERGVGRAAYEERLTLVRRDLEAVDQTVADARRKVEERGVAPVDAPGVLASIRLWLNIWALKVVLAGLDVVVMRAAIAAALPGSEISPFEQLPAALQGLVNEATAIAVVVGLAQATVATAIGKVLRTARLRRRVTVVATTVAGLVLLGVIAVVAVVRGVGVQVMAALVAAESAHTAAAPPRASTTEVIVLVSGILLVSVTAVVLQQLLSAAPEQIDYRRALRDRATKRAHLEATVHNVDAVVLVLEYLQRDTQRAAEESAYYGDRVLPALAELKVETYLAELARRMADPAFTDALRTLPQHEPFAPVARADAVPEAAPADPDGA